MFSIVNFFDIDQKMLKIDDDDEEIYQIVMIIIIRNIVNEIDYKVQRKRNCRSKKCREFKLFIESRN